MRYGFTQSIPGLNPWWDYIPCNRTRPQGTRGGIILAASISYFTVDNICLGKYIVSAKIKDLSDGNQFSITGVYGPQDEVDKQEFLDELLAAPASMLQQWCVVGDFNLIYSAVQKSTGRLNFRIMNRFRDTLDTLELKEMPLRGKNILGLVVHPHQHSHTFAISSTLNIGSCTTRLPTCRPYLLLCLITTPCCYLLCMFTTLPGHSSLKHFGPIYLDIWLV